MAAVRNDRAPCPRRTWRREGLSVDQESQTQVSGDKCVWDVALALAAHHLCSREMEACMARGGRQRSVGPTASESVGHGQAPAFGGLITCCSSVPSTPSPALSSRLLVTGRPPPLLPLGGTSVPPARPSALHGAWSGAGSPHEATAHSAGPSVPRCVWETAFPTAQLCPAPERGHRARGHWAARAGRPAGAPNSPLPP